MDSVLDDKPGETQLEVEFSSGLLLDATNRLVLCIQSSEMVGVLLSRLDFIPDPEEVLQLVYEGQWVTVFHSDPGNLFFMEPDEQGRPASSKVKRFIGAPANESAAFAIGIGLARWPNWCLEWEIQYAPQTLIRLPRDLPEG